MATNKHQKTGMNLTVMYRTSVTGNGVYGFIKEMPEAISEGKDEKELAANLIKAMTAVFEAKRIEFESTNKQANSNDDQFEETELLLEEK